MDDLRARLARPAPFDVVGLGEASWDAVWLVPEPPPWGGKARASRRDQLGGGQIATALVACRRLGLSAAWIGKLGDDQAGRAILDGLAAEGVDVSAAATVAGAASHAAVVVVDRQGRRTVLFHDDERARMAPADVPAARAASGRVLHLDASDLEASIAAARAAREADRAVTLDLDRFESRTPALLAFADVCIASEAVIHSLPGALAGSAEEGLARLRGLGAGVACTTRGERGALALDDDGLHSIAAMQHSPVVDTTACGDTFCAGLIAGLLDGQPLDGALAFAAAAAALKTRDLGRRGCPTRDEVLALVPR